MRGLDFICIGAPRAGTTSLYMALRQHPEIYVPMEKGVPIENIPIDVHMKKYFGGHEDKVIGEFVPGYMHHVGCADIVHSHWPEARIIVMLRHPVKRAYSYWNMLRRGGVEHASFDEAFYRPGNIYRRCSLYGKILDPYYNLFKDILVVFFEDFVVKPELAIRQVFDFLGVSSFTPKHLDVQYNSAWQFSTLLQKVARNIPGKQLVPRHLKHWVWWILERRHPQQKPPEIDYSIYFDQEFIDDKELLEQLVGKVPW